MKNSQILNVMNNFNKYYYSKDYDSSKKELDIIDNINVNEIGKEFTKNHGLPSKPLYLCIGKSKKAQPITTKKKSSTKK